MGKCPDMRNRVVPHVTALLALALPGVITAITVHDVPGDPDIAPVFPGEPVLAKGVVEFHGQPVAAIAATDLTTARRAARLVRVTYEDLPTILGIEEALEQQSLLMPPLGLKRGDAYNAKHLAVKKDRVRNVGQFRAFAPPGAAVADMIGAHIAHHACGAGCKSILKSGAGGDAPSGAKRSLRQAGRAGGR